MSETAPPTPSGASFVDARVLRIAWSDDRELDYAPEVLRAACPCAHCTSADSSAGVREAASHRNVTVSSVQELGRYALQISFSDGHEHGIYGYAQLRELGSPKGEAPAAPADPEAFSV